MENVTARFGKYSLKDIAQEFKATASLTEMEYVLQETVGVPESSFALRD